MRGASAARLIAVLALFLVLGVAPTQAAAPFAALSAKWSRMLQTVEAYVNGPEHRLDRTAEFRKLLARVADQATAARDDAKAKVAATQTLLDALGPPPKAGAPAEAPAIAAKRRQYTDAVTEYRARMGFADLALARAKQLDAALAGLERQTLIERLLAPAPAPLAPETLVKGVPELARALARVAGSPLAWYRGLRPEARAKVRLSPFLVAVGLAALVGWAARRLLLARFGRRPEVAAPRYARALLAAIAEGVARGIVPALIVAAFLYQVTRPTALISGLYADAVVALGQALIFVFLAVGIARAALAPDNPAWRLTPLIAEGARAISRRVVALAAVVAVDLFVTGATRSLALSPDARAVHQLVFDGLEGLGILLLLQGSLWRAHAKTGEEGEAAPPGRVWTLVRLAAGLLTVAGLVATLAGRPTLGDYLIKNILATGVVIGALFVVRGLVREAIGLAVRAERLQRLLGLAAAGRQRLKFWLRAALDPLLLGAAAYLVLPWWGVPVDQMWAWTTEVLHGVTIGTVTISPIDIALGLVVFAGLFAASRMLQRALEEKILPQTSLHPSVRHSITAATGYLGTAIAAAAGVGTVGFDLSNLALIAGALSVGIGFGLQNVVNNFVSGIILLIERPIKVGDWVVVGGHEGYVKSIKVRATELQTFQRAAVIIPNSEILSTAVVNWTFKDTYGRVEVPVGVAYGSDVEKVREILLGIAAEHPRVTPMPEPYVLFRDFGASSLDFELRAYLTDIGWIMRVASDLRFAIDRAFRDAGIEIPFPQTDVHLRDIERLERALSPRPREG